MSSKSKISSDGATDRCASGPITYALIVLPANGSKFVLVDVIIQVVPRKYQMPDITNTTAYSGNSVTATSADGDIAPWFWRYCLAETGTMAMNWKVSPLRLKILIY